MRNHAQPMKSWPVVCLVALLVATGAAFAALLPVRAFAGELEAGLMTQGLGPRVQFVDVNGGSWIMLSKGGPAQTYSAGGGTVTCLQEASGKIKITLNNAKIGENDISSAYRVQFTQDWTSGSSYPVELVLEGDNTIALSSTSKAHAYGISFYNTDDVTISGSGTLTFSNIYMSPFSWGKPSSESSIDESGTLTINGPTVHAESYDMGAKTSRNNEGKLSIAVKSGSLSCSRLFAYSYEQTGGVVAVSEISTTSGSSAAYADAFTLTGGAFEVTGQFEGLNAASATIRGGTLIVTGKQSDALLAHDKLAISGGNVSVTAGSNSYAINTQPSTKVAVKPACLKNVKGYLGKGVSFMAGGNTYKVTAATAKTASKDAVFNATLSKGANVKKMTVNTATVGGTTYKVTAVGKKALAKKTKLANATFGPNVKKIGAQALAGSKKVKAITVKSTALNAKSVKNSLKGSSVGMVKVPANKVGVYTNIFAQKNCGKKVTVKAA